jgi:alkane 1-monooxygenase
MMRPWRSIKYLAVYITPAVVFFSLYSKDGWSYFALAFVFLIVPFTELFTKGSSLNLSEAEEEVAKKDRLYDWLLYGLVPVQYALMVYFLWQISQPDVSAHVKFGMMTAFGMACGVLGINAAHELGHRQNAYEQIMSKMLLLTTLYMHFFIEHNRGHHKYVATDEDPASSRPGESVYRFYFRSVKDSWLSAWRLERERLQKSGQRWFSWRNEMLQFQVYQGLLVIGIGWYFSAETLLYFMGAATIGFLLLETVNYIEHYGLRRRKSGNRYERTLPVHSWNSNHPVGRLLLLELSRHSDHHYMANRKYQTLRHFDESPQMPTGYPGMMLLALIPPLWFYIMDREIEKYKRGQAGAYLA